MPTINVVDMTGKKVSEIELSEALFGIKPNPVVMHMAIVNYLAAQRQGTQSTRTRAEVSGGGRKPWRQKGTGHARQGSTRSPQWRHGGIALGPKPRDYDFKLNKKVRRLAIKSAFSAKLLEESLIVLDGMDMSEYKTRTVADMLKAVDAGKKPLIILSENNKYAVRSTDNIPGAKTAQVGTINAYDLINASKLIIVKDAVQKLEEVYAK